VISDDLNKAINLVCEETGLVPEVDSAEELASALLEWGSVLALENKQLRTELAALKGEPATRCSDVTAGPFGGRDCAWKTACPAQ